MHIRGLQERGERRIALSASGSGRAMDLHTCLHARARLHRRGVYMYVERVSFTVILNMILLFYCLFYSFYFFVLFPFRFICPFIYVYSFIHFIVTLFHFFPLSTHLCIYLSIHLSIYISFIFFIFRSISGSEICTRIMGISFHIMNSFSSWTTRHGAGSGDH